MPESTIRVPCKISRLADMRSRTTGYRAVLGEFQGEARTAAEAKQALAEQVAAYASEPSAGLIMYDLVEPGTIWVVRKFSPGSWGYEFIRPAPEGRMPRGATGCSGTSICAKTREEAEDRLRAHWYQNNIEPVVLGVLGLCTDERQWTCVRCQSVQRSEPPYRCQSPNCGQICVFDFQVRQADGTWKTEGEVSTPWTDTGLDSDARNVYRSDPEVHGLRRAQG